MDQTALEVIRKHSRLSKTKVKKQAQAFIDLISKKYPEGDENSTYFVMPGFKHVTKNQPIISFDQTEGQWILDINTKFRL